MLCGAFLCYRKHLLFESVEVNRFFCLGLSIGVGVRQEDFHAGERNTALTVVGIILNAFGRVLERFFHVLHDLVFLAAENERAVFGKGLFCILCHRVEHFGIDENVVGIEVLIHRCRIQFDTEEVIALFFRFARGERDA